MSYFDSIAIVGRGCALPGGCFSPLLLSQLLASNQSAISEPDPNYWRINPIKDRGADAREKGLNHALSSTGGYVKGFSTVFNPAEYDIDEDIISQLDPLFQWNLFAAKEALKEAQLLKSSLLSSTGVIVGNLGYPTKTLCQLYKSFLFKNYLFDLNVGDRNPESYNRFMSGLPAILLKNAFGLGGDAFALETACATSLYAIKYACDYLNNHLMDVMLVGGVNGSDMTYLHEGFTALQALSPTGQSRPFNAEADGLVPGEGSAFIVLKRLRDAERAGDSIFAVIKGVSLSNDGGKKGLLVPSSEGQIRCMREALAMAKMHSGDVGYIECHATGVSLGDKTELESMHEVYHKDGTIPIGSIKANMGHLITASGIVGILKLIASFENDCFYPTPNVTPPLPEVRQNGFRLLSHVESWPRVDGARAAAISNFGFGGNNAHLILQEWKKNSVTYPQNKAEVPQCAIVAIELKTDKSSNLLEFLTLFLNPLDSNSNHLDSISFPRNQLHYPPNDLRESPGQQLLILKLAMNLAPYLENVSREKIALFIGAETDPELCRNLIRGEIQDFLEKNQIILRKESLENLYSELAHPLTAAQVKGYMLNLIANLVNKTLHIEGPGVVVMGEELSGDYALQLACLSLQKKEIDVALVGAVDFSSTHFEASVAKQLHASTHQKLADGGVLMVIKRLNDAVEAGDTILAIVSTNKTEQKAAFGNYHPVNTLSQVVGHVHAASGLLHTALAALLLHFRIMPNPFKKEWMPLLPDENQKSIIVKNQSSFGGDCTTILTPYKHNSLNREGILSRPSIYTFAAPSLDQLKVNIIDGVESREGEMRLAIVGKSEEVDQLRIKAIELLSKDGLADGWIHPKIIFRRKKIEGLVAAVMTDSSSNYRGMGKDLLLAFPQLIDHLQTKFNVPESFFNYFKWVYDPRIKRETKDELEASMFFIQIHAECSLNIIGLTPDAYIGLSAGELSAFFATGLWSDIGSLFMKSRNSQFIEKYLTNDYLLLQNLDSTIEHTWQNWLIIAPVEEVEEIVSQVNLAYITIIYTPTRCVLSGTPSACKAVIDKLPDALSILSNYGLLFHSPLLIPYQDILAEMHHQPDGYRNDLIIYSTYLNEAFDPTQEKLIQSYLGGATTTANFPKIIETAWNDGVRIFVEHGAMHVLADSIQEILGEREHLVISLDFPPTSSLLQFFKTAADLWTLDIPVSFDRLYPEKATLTSIPSGPSDLSFPVRLPPLQFTPPVHDLEKERELEKPSYTKN